MSYSILGPDGRPFDESLADARQVNFGKTKKVYQKADGTYAITHENVLTAGDNPDNT